ncbi:hypothetical protein D3C81_1807060 [compost metagenome]
MPSSWVKGTAPTTFGCFSAASASGCQSSSGPLTCCSTACGTMPRMRERISFWKPFITDSTTIIASTPRDRPIIEVSEMNEM